jgi:2-polyprenyl-3-methyl-5-hydroxy-6-metoxy-1,4-benzoquinol methylase
MICHAQPGNCRDGPCESLVIGALLKQLGPALGNYVSYRARRAVGLSVAPVAKVQPPSPGPPIVAFQPRAAFEWRRVHDDGEAYLDTYHPMVPQYLSFPPRMALDVGCNTGMLGATLKESYPECRVWGVEPDARAAAIARSRLDRVLETPFGDIDWGKEGIAVGSFDTVFLLDVLEHMYDPWKALLTIRGMLQTNAQVLITIPNVRNILLMQDLVNGNFRYRPVGLLDITHIRFFAHDDLMRIFYQTGFRVKQIGATLCEPARAIQNKYAAGPFPQRIECGRISVDVMSLDDLTNLCAVQNLYRLEPAEYDTLSDKEKLWIDGPHPETLTFAGS